MRRPRARAGIGRIAKEIEPKKLFGAGDAYAEFLIVVVRTVEGAMAIIFDRTIALYLLPIEKQPRLGLEARARRNLVELFRLGELIELPQQVVE